MRNTVPAVCVVIAILTLLSASSSARAQVIFEAMPARYEVLPGYNPRLTVEQAARLASVSMRPSVVIVDPDEGALALREPLLVGGPYRRMDGLYVRRVDEQPLFFRKRDLLPAEMLPEPRDRGDAADRGDAVRDEDRDEGRDETRLLEQRVPARMGPAQRPADGKMQAGEIRIFPSRPAPAPRRTSDKSDAVTP